MTKLSEKEDQVMSCFNVDFGYTFSDISKRINMDAREVRRVCRRLARKGYLYHTTFYCEYDGMFRGSGYFLTGQGEQYSKEHF